jgi:hypothetical protein
MEVEMARPVAEAASAANAVSYRSGADLPRLGRVVRKPAVSSCDKLRSGGTWLLDHLIGAASSGAGTVRPSAFTVFIFVTSS